MSNDYDGAVNMRVDSTALYHYLPMSVYVQVCIRYLLLNVKCCWLGSVESLESPQMRSGQGGDPYPARPSALIPLSSRIRRHQTSFYTSVSASMFVDGREELCY